MSEGDLPHAFVIDAKALREIIDRTRFAMSSEETRYYLNGVYMHPAEGRGRGQAPHRRHRRPPPRAGRDGAARGGLRKCPA